MMKNNGIYLIGAGGHAKVIADILEKNNFSILGIIDKNLAGTSFLKKYAVKADWQDFEIKDVDNFIIGIGNNQIRKSISNDLLNGRFFAIIKDKSSNISIYSHIGEGSVVMPGVTINVDVKIGAHCIINTNSSIDHDCILDDFVHISPNVGLAGNVQVGEGTHIGIGASVIQGIKIGKWCTIGAGAVVIQDVPDFAVLVGNPGKIIKFNINI